MLKICPRCGADVGFGIQYCYQCNLKLRLSYPASDDSKTVMKFAFENSFYQMELKEKYSNQNKDIPEASPKPKADKDGWLVCENCKTRNNINQNDFCTNCGYFFDP